MKTVIIGAQWGDEGKGKIVDYLAEKADIIIRYSGGANAGHTIVTGDRTYKLHLVPSGIVYNRKTVVLGTGMVIDPEAFFAELEELSQQGIDWQGRVLVSDRAHLVLPSYKKEDRQNDSSRANPIGTTGRGIGTTYAHKARRDGIRVIDLYDSHRYNSLNKDERDFLDPYRQRLEKMVINLVSFVEEHKNSLILYEGAQGILLDLDIGTYPYVSSGTSAAAGASSGGGIGPRGLDKVLGVCKAYSTRVGNGPFPTEFRQDRDGDLENIVRETGREYGVTTGRARRCGYLDLPALKYACLANSIDSLALTHLDVYDEFDEVIVCTAYRYNDSLVTDFPSSIQVLEKAEPVLKSFPGWKTCIAEVNAYEDLPANAKRYVEFIEEYTGTPIGIISVGYQRTQTIVR